MGPHTFMDVRNGAHHAAQIASSLGATHLRSGDVHTDANLSWDLRLGALMGRPVCGVRAGIRLHDLTWILTRDGRLVSEKPCAGHPLADGYTWLQYQAREHSDMQIPDVLPRPVDYELPRHEVVDGALYFNGGQPQLATLARWYATASVVLEQVRRNRPDASEVLCWPHHFDVATLIAVEPDLDDPERPRSIGVGMTPGDAAIPEPYWYVTPWPYPDDRTGPALPAGGHWHTQGWFGATLRESTLEGSTRGVLDFVDEAISACRDLLG